MRFDGVEVTQAPLSFMVMAVNCAVFLYLRTKVSRTVSGTAVVLMLPCWHACCLIGVLVASLACLCQGIGFEEVGMSYEKVHRRTPTSTTLATTRRTPHCVRLVSRCEGSGGQRDLEGPHSQLGTLRALSYRPPTFNSAIYGI